jgi:hypothetical protein
MFAILLAAGIAGGVPATRPQPIDAGSWISSGDYPWGAIVERMEGVTAVSLTVDQGGAVSSCTVTATSGSDLLDGTTCALIKMRARFEAARDRLNRPVVADYAQKVRWQLPKDADKADFLEFVQLLRSDGGVSLEIDVDVDGKGTVAACSVRASKGLPGEVTKLCDAVRGKPLPADGDFLRAKRLTLRASATVSGPVAPAR